MPLSRELTTSNGLGARADLGDQISSLTRTLFLTRGRGERRIRVHSGIRHGITRRSHERHSRRLHLLTRGTHSRTHRVAERLRQTTQERRQRLRERSPAGCSSDLNLAVQSQRRVHGRCTCSLRQSLHLTHLPPTRHATILRQRTSQSVSRRVTLNRRPTTTTTAIDANSDIFSRQLFSHATNVTTKCTNKRSSICGLCSRPLFTTAGTLRVVCGPQAKTISRSNTSVRRAFQKQTAFTSPGSVSRRKPIRFRGTPITGRSPFKISRFLSRTGQKGHPHTS